jgi:hypothetical protein
MMKKIIQVATIRFATYFKMSSNCLIMKISTNKQLQLITMIKYRKNKLIKKKYKNNRSN